MRRLWFAILLALSLVVSGTAGAWAAQACPFKQAPALALQHDCCPDQKQAPQPANEHDKKMDCQLGQACRASHAVQAIQPVLTITTVETVVTAAPRNQPEAPQSIPTGLWRPPKSV